MSHSPPRVYGISNREKNENISGSDMETSDNDLDPKKVFQNYPQQPTDFKKEEIKKITLNLNHQQQLQQQQVSLVENLNATAAGMAMSNTSFTLDLGSVSPFILKFQLLKNALFICFDT